jgi:hypothetical protein
MTKRIKIKVPEESSLLHIEDFHKRWNIQLSDAERWKNFKDRILNSYTSWIGNQVLYESKMTNEFFNLIGIHINRTNSIFGIEFLGNGFDNCLVYNYFTSSRDIKKFILGIEILFRMKTIEKKIKVSFIKDIQEAIVITGVPLEVKQTDTDILFYPAGAKLLDEKLVNDNLDWLLQYPKSYEAFKSALLKYGKKEEERDVVDNLRLSLELLIRDILNNKKSLENQKNEIGIFLKSKNVSAEISNLFWTTLDYYAKYQNNKAKHENTVPSNEVEFILYLTGTLMRFLLTK